MKGSPADIKRLETALAMSWSAASSSSPHWSPDNPALGQCAVTAMIVQDLLGGELLRCMVGDVSHYWNVLSDGTEVDFTRSQFDSFPADPYVEIRHRSHLESSPNTRLRYFALSLRFGHAWFSLEPQPTTVSCGFTYPDGLRCHGTLFRLFPDGRHVCSWCNTSGSL